MLSLSVQDGVSTARNAAGEIRLQGDLLIGPAGARRLRPAERLPIRIESGAPILDAMARLALEEIDSLRTEDRVDGRRIVRFKAGTAWPEAWARDTAYSIDLGLAFIHPEETRASLDACVERRDFLGRPVAPRVRQDGTLDFGSWPNLTDGIVWAHGAREWQFIHGGGVAADYEVVRNALARAEREVLDPADGLFRGVASFMESHGAYPDRYDFFRDPFHRKIGRTKALSTNVLYVMGYRAAEAMAEKVGDAKAAASYRARALKLRRNIEAAFRDASTGTYGYFKDENGRVDGRFEAMGTLLAVRSGHFPGAKRALASAPSSAFGTPCLWPPHPEWRWKERFWDLPHAQYGFYHNGMVWPFVEAYAGWMAARQGRADACFESMVRLARLAARELTFREYHHWESGRGGGSRAQLWSAAGYLGLFLRGALGLEAGPKGLLIAPNMPRGLGGTLKVKGLRYGQATLDVEVYGSGRNVRSFTLDGAEASRRIPPGLRGRHAIRIEVAP